MFNIMSAYKVKPSDEYIINPRENMDLREDGAGRFANYFGLTVALDLSMPKTITSEHETEKDTHVLTNTVTGATVSENKCDIGWLVADWQPSRDPQSNIDNVKSNFPQAEYEESPESGSSGDISGGDSCSATKPSRGSLLSSSDEIAKYYESEQNGYDDESIMKQCRNVTVILHGEKIWRQFAKWDTKMIVNRGGRRMFPHIVLSLNGLEPVCMYSIAMEIVPADNHRYKYINNNWTAMGMADAGPDIKTIVHPDSPNTGSFWQNNRANFSKVRLTNSKESSRKDNGDGCVLLLPMHKYKAVIKIHNETDPCDNERIFDFPESTFIALTAHQNNQIPKLTIQNNPTAKAFRDTPNQMTRIDRTPGGNSTLNNTRVNTVNC